MTRLVRVLQATTTAVRNNGSEHSTTTTTSNMAQSASAPPPEAAALESDFVVILAALLCALIGVVGLIAVARCSCLRRGGGVAATRAPANKGLKKKVLQSLPKFTYIGGGGSSSNSDSNNDNNCNKRWMVTSDCAICLAEFQEGDEIRVLPQCGHGFHLGCIDTWLVSHSSCPSCRQILVAPRCQKCGLYPSMAGGGSGSGVVVVTVNESEMRAGEAANASEVSASGVGQHQADNDNGNNTNTIANDNQSGNSTRTTFLP